MSKYDWVDDYTYLEDENSFYAHAYRGRKERQVIPLLLGKIEKGESKMQTNLVKELTAAHINSLNSSVHALETQVTILRTLLNGGQVSNTCADETDNDSDDTDFAPPAKKTKKKAAGTKSFEDDDAASDDAPAESDDEDADFAPPAKKGKKAAKSFDDEEEEEESEETTPPKKAAKAKKITMDDVNDACMERAGRTNRAEVLSVLKTKFKVKTVTALKPEQYEEVVAAMKGKK